ncbi:nicotinamidase-related amidase [Orbus hercynius]|uniref:Nicotinamidase-related amidase n=1 Tax=Orbus hercynius TaxID=593135 RepID=A0A495RCX5_9GAMM|nr:cysteine hydrolase [Orbus hercynius]RKS85130.1 nicotinamidase-related amidase [Orbus hercynius]
MNTAFIGIDYIIDITHPDGKIPHSSPNVIQGHVIEHANRILTLAGEKNWLKLLVKVGFSTHYTEQPKSSPLFGQLNQIGGLSLDTKGTDFHPDLHAHLADMVIIKPRVSAFYCTELEAALRANKIERLIIAGVSTSMTVQSTAREAHDRDYQVVIVEDACAAPTQAEHNSSIEFLKGIATVVDAEQLAKMV